MKKYLFLLLIVIAMPVFAEENFTVNLNVGNVGFGGNLPLSDNYSPEFMFTLMNIGIEYQETNAGLEINPFKCFFWGGTDTDGVYSFVNLNLYWNILNYEFDGDGVIYFGPFASVNYLFLENDRLNFDRYIFTGGAQLGFRMKIGRVNYNLVSVEVGYRRFDDQESFFVGGKVDIIAFFTFLLLLYS